MVLSQDLGLDRSKMVPSQERCQESVLSPDLRKNDILGDRIRSLEKVVVTFGGVVSVLLTFAEYLKIFLDPL